jgi:type I restriction enzyme S subunit
MTNEVKNVPEIRFPGFEDEWEKRVLGEIAKIVGGGTPKTEVPEYWNGEINWYSPVEIGDSNFVYESRNKVTELGLKKSSAKILPIGTVLFTARAGIGNTAILKKEGATNQGFQSIIPKENMLDTYFIFSRTNELKRYGEIHGAGSTFVEVSGKEMAKMPISTPNIGEQQKIGHFFSKLDRQIELEEQKLEKLEQQKKGYMQKIFSQQLRFKDEKGNDYPDWEEKQLGDVTNYSTSKRSSNFYDELENKGNYSVYDANKEIFKDDTFDAKEKYISILKDGAGAGRLNLRPGMSSVIGTMGYINVVSVNIEYLYYRMTIINFTKYIIGSTIPHLYYKDYSKEIIEIPDIKEQKKIGYLFKKFERRKILIKEKIDRLKNRKQAFLQKMFI